MLKVPMDSRKIITLAGVRRSGKTYHLFNLMRELRASGVPTEKILYINSSSEEIILEELGKL